MRAVAVIFAFLALPALSTVVWQSGFEETPKSQLEDAGFNEQKKSFQNRWYEANLNAPTDLPGGWVAEGLARVIRGVAGAWKSPGKKDGDWIFGFHKVPVTTLSATIDTIEGKNYELSFWIRHRLGYPARKFKAFIDGACVVGCGDADTNTDLSWLNKVRVFRAESDQVTILFKDMGGNTGTTFLDAVQLKDIDYFKVGDNYCRGANQEPLASTKFDDYTVEQCKASCDVDVGCKAYKSNVDKRCWNYYDYAMEQKDSGNQNQPAKNQCYRKEPCSLYGGIRNKNGNVCCPASCGVCGGDNCSSREGGSACCSGTVAQTQPCSPTVDAPCTANFDCAGTQDGDAEEDLCGVCGGDNSSCLIASSTVCVQNSADFSMSFGMGDQSSSATTNGEHRCMDIPATNAGEMVQITVQVTDGESKALKIAAVYTPEAGVLALDCTGSSDEFHCSQMDDSNGMGEMPLNDMGCYDAGESPAERSAACDGDLECARTGYDGFDFGGCVSDGVAGPGYDNHCCSVRPGQLHDIGCYDKGSDEASRDAACAGDLVCARKGYSGRNFGGCRVQGESGPPYDNHCCSVLEDACTPFGGLAAADDGRACCAAGCGTCGGDSCADEALGEANCCVDAIVGGGNACDGDGSAPCALEDCAGVAGGTAVHDECGVCNGDNSTCAGCDGVPNSGLVNDECGVCNGNNDTCLDCNNVPNGGAVQDQCGECDGDASTCTKLENDTSCYSAGDTVEARSESCGGTMQCARDGFDGFTFGGCKKDGQAGPPENEHCCSLKEGAVNDIGCFMEDAPIEDMDAYCSGELVCARTGYNDRDFGGCTNQGIAGPPFHHHCCSEVPAPEPINTLDELKAWCNESTSNCSDCKGSDALDGATSYCKVNDKKVVKCKNFKKHPELCDRLNGCSFFLKAAKRPGKKPKAKCKGGKFKYDY